MTKEKGDNKKKDRKGGGKGKGHTHNVVPHHAPSKKVHNKEYDPVYVGSGEIKSHAMLDENLSKKERHAVEKLEAQIEYAEAHGQDQEAQKFRDRIDAINEKAVAKAAHDAPLKVVHSGGHWKHHKKDAKIQE